ncbi:uncharacterized protein LOC114074698 [Solanum pennellii]|uniref:RNA-directed DNA polymerase n=1 Tax=Solanum pennellii TaxID=28526 RepID=A0ABM1UYC3_SOLPN|nr:uncharacterized protein LOC114074698 [Solanum pennellii]
MASLEALYRRQCRSPIDRIDSAEIESLDTDLLSDAMEEVHMIQYRLLTTHSRQKSYADRRVRALVIMEGNHVWLRVSPMKGMMRFGKKGKLRPRFIGPFEILSRVGEVSYKLALPPSLSAVHLVFHVSMLRKYIPDESHVISLDSVEQGPDWTFEEEPIAILDRQVRKLRTKEISSVKNVKDLPGAIAAADSLIDFRTTRLLTDIPSTSKTKKKNDKKGEWKKDSGKDCRNDKGKAQMKDGKDKPKNKDGNYKGCWTCGGPHLAKSCPNREKVNTLLAGNMNQREEDEEIVAAMAKPLGLSFNNITWVNNVGETSSTLNPHASLIHIELTVKEQRVMAMVDTGAIHTLIDVKIATKLGLKLSKSPSFVKTVNAKAHAIVGIAYCVSMSTENWVGKHNLMVMPLGQFEIILGIDFLRKFQFVPFLNLDGVMVMNGSNDGFLKGVHPFGNINKVSKKKYKGMFLYAMSIDKGLKKGDHTILAALVEVKPDVQMEVPDCIAELLKQYADGMPPELSKNLPPRRDIDHKIKLLSGTVAPAQAPYRMAPKELAELRKQLNELLDARLVQPSKAPYGDSVLFQKKQDGTMRMCVDYRALNKEIVKNKYPVPLVQDLMDKLSKACWFTKLDLRAGYWQVGIAEGVEPKTTCVTRYGSYEFLVMPFRLTNAPTTFCNLMNNVLFDYLDDFVVVYLDDIFIYCRTLEEHVNHLCLVLSQLRKYTLYAKMEKCEFTQQEIKFWGIVKFNAGYSKRAAALTDLLKKDMKWLPFEVHTDASDKAIGGVLVQEGHPVAFGSRKLNDAEQRYSTDEKEMVAVVDYLHVWRVYLLGTRFVVRTDNVANTFFKTQKNLSPKQAQWQEFLAEYDFVWEHKQGKYNKVNDALSRKEVFVVVYSISKLKTDFYDRIRLCAANDSLYVKWMVQVQDGTIRRY